MSLVAKEFKEVMASFYAGLVIIIFVTPALVLFIPTLGWSWRLTNIVDRIFGIGRR